MPKASEVKNVKPTAEADMKKDVKTAEVKAADVKTAEVKAAVDTKAAEAKAAELKEPVKEEKAPAKKTAARKTTKTTERKAAATRKTAAANKKIEESICIQYAGKELEASELLGRAKAAYGNAKAIKEIRVYVKPEENMAYYVVNGDETGSIEL